MYTYLFFPLPTDEAIVLRFNESLDASFYKEYINTIQEDVKLYEELLQDEKYTVFCKHQYASGLSLKNNCLKMGVTINYGPAEPQTKIFFDTLDLQKPHIQGKSGYGYFAVEIIAGTEGIYYNDGKVLVTCEIIDDSMLKNTLTTSLSFSLYIKALEQLLKKTLPKQA